MTSTNTPSEDATVAATRIMLRLSGSRWTWPRRRVTELYWVPKTAHGMLHLAGRPVKAVESVTGYNDQVLTAELSDRFRLHIPALDHKTWPWWSFPGTDLNGGVYPSAWRMRRGTPVRVTYVYGSRPPVDMQKAINQLAVELDNAFAGRDCALPDRVTSVSREGVSWTIIDPQQFLDQGRTGLYFPDLVLSSLPARKARPRAFSPEHLPPRRLTSVVVPESE